MATLPPVDSPPAVRVILKWFVGADANAITRHWFSYSGGPPTAADLATMAGAIGASLATHLGPLMNASVENASVECTDMASSSGADSLVATGTVGTRTGAELPADAAMVISHKIGRRYRGGKPRSYVPLGSVTDLQNSQEWTNAFVGAVNTGWGAFIAAITSHTFGSIVVNDIINVSYYLGGTWEPYGTPTKYRRIPTLRATPVEDVITGHSARAILGSQRRRL